MSGSLVSCCYHKIKIRQETDLTGGQATSYGSHNLWETICTSLKNRCWLSSSRLLHQTKCLCIEEPHPHFQWPHRGFTALPSKAVAAGHQIVPVGRHITVGLDVLLGWKSIGHLPGTAIPHPAHIHSQVIIVRIIKWNYACAVWSITFMDQEAFGQNQSCTNTFK